MNAAKVVLMATWLTWGTFFLLPEKAQAWIWKRMELVLATMIARSPIGRPLVAWVDRRRTRRIHRQAWSNATKDACRDLTKRLGMDPAGAKLIGAWGEHVVDCPLCRDVTVGNGAVTLMCPPGRGIFDAALEAGRRAAFGNGGGLEAAAARAGLLEDRTVD